MENHQLKWAYDMPECGTEICPADCRQYLASVPEKFAEILPRNPSTPMIMDALKWNVMTPEELELVFPGSEPLISHMIAAGLVCSECGMLTLSEAYYDHPIPMDSDELYWYLVSEKREWGLFLKDVMESLAMRLIANKFGTSYDSIDIMDLDLNISDEKMTEAGNRLFGVLASLLTDEDPESLFERWTKEVH